MFSMKALMVESDMPKLAEIIAFKKAKAKPTNEAIRAEIDRLKKMNFQESVNMLKTIIDESKEPSFRNYQILYSNEILLNDKPFMGYFTRDYYLNILDAKESILMTSNLLRVLIVIR